MTLRIAWHEGPRAGLRSLFELAEDSKSQLDGSIDLGRVLVAWDGDEVIGHIQLIEGPEPGQIELKSVAVIPARQGMGIGRALVAAAVERSAASGRSRMVVSTGAADTGALRFYQRVGFRMTSIERDAFSPATGYPDPILIDGILLRDRVWLSRELRGG
jgi:ribosomal protein S18 acetylase RimI-like enzyme